jgi:O-antigen/teichoic acid export membrane protein
MTQRRATTRSLVWVYAAAAIRLLGPLLILPLMASRLGPQEFGRLSQWLVWAVLLSVPVEGGFGAAATRLVVNADAARRAELVQQVFSARCVWSGVMALAALCAAWWGAASGPEALLLAALALATGWPATWYLQATGQLHRLAAIELVVQAAAWIAAALWAHSGVVFLLIVSLALSLQAWLGWRLVRNTTVTTAALWSAPACRQGLALGRTMLPVALAGAAYSHALPAVASVRMAHGELGLYYLADRWVRAALMAVDPLAQWVYPRIVERFAQGLLPAFKFALRWALAGLAAGAAALLLLDLLWPAIATRLPPGIDAPALRAVLGISACLLPLLLSWKPLGLWMLGSARFDTAYRMCMIGGALAGLSLVWLAPTLDAITLARIALAVEILVIGLAVAGIAWRLRWASTSTT